MRPLWERIHAALAHRRFSVCFVDDGSGDGTLDVLRQLECEHRDRVHVITRVKRRRGSQRGSALRTAMLWALQDPSTAAFVEMDGDLSHRPEELAEGLALIESGRWDVAIASKYVPGSRIINRPFGRTAVSFLCNLAVRALVSPSIRDYSNGFRFYSRRAAEIVAHARIRYGSPIYLTEVMALWLAAGCRIAEFTTTYVGRNEGLSKLRRRDLAKAAIAVFEISARYHLRLSVRPENSPLRSRPESDAEVS